ncbi:unnamed protein product [Lepeophtheirus salmonis]|nr:unnamed protein product [Lepeophtheirus salmonis]CAF2925647.1 unnamed protein product [Lepeophtheirus salmonis]
MVLIGGTTTILIPSKRMTEIEENPGVCNPSEIDINSNVSRETIEESAPEDLNDDCCDVEGEVEEQEERVPSPAPVSIVIKEIPIGDPRIRSKIKFQVVTAHVTEAGGKKHVLYTIMMKRINDNSRPAIINRRYNDF